MSAKAQSLLHDPVQPPLILRRPMPPPLDLSPHCSGINYRPLRLSTPRYVFPSLKCGNAWRQDHIWSPWSARPGRPACVCPMKGLWGVCMCASVGAQGRDYAMTEEDKIRLPMCLPGQVSHCCLQGGELGANGVWVSLGERLGVYLSPWSGSESRLIGP